MNRFDFMGRLTRDPVIRYTTDNGITPAYAGNSSFDTLDFFIFQDHPRIRGE